MILSLAVLVGACSGLVDSVTPAPTSTPVIGPESATPWIPGLPTGLTCGSLFAPPAYDQLALVPGISVRAIDQGHFEIRNATDRTYYFAVFYWETVDNLVCGRGVTFRDPIAGPVGPGSVFVVDGGSTTEIPATVSIWADPCGEACTRAPMGELVVPISNVPAPPPISS